jgi:hypothetical protein
MPDIWTFYECEEKAGEWLVEEHLSSARPELEVKFNSRCRHLVQMNLDEWSPVWTKPLRGKQCDGLVELRFKANKVQQRPLGFFGPGASEFTIVIWAIEKGDALVPKDACKIGKQREAEVRAGKRQIRPLAFE